MTQRFIVRPRAEHDIQAAFEWYESEQPGLGNDFLSSLRQALVRQKMIALFEKLRTTSLYKPCHDWTWKSGTPDSAMVAPRADPDRAAAQAKFGQRVHPVAACK
jgi:hypothetical protein